MARVAIPSSGCPPRDRLVPPEPIPVHVRANEKENVKDSRDVKWRETFTRPDETRRMVIFEERRRLSSNAGKSWFGSFLCPAPATLGPGMPRTPRGRHVAPHPRGLHAPPLFGWCRYRSSPRKRLFFVSRLPFLPVAHAKLFPFVSWPYYYAILKATALRSNVVK